jgi:hypothetical protein
MIRKLGNTEIREYHNASCHCGAVELEIHLPNGIEAPGRCDCSMCRRRGAIVAQVPLSRIRILKGEGSLTLYQFHTMTAEHYFCATCGVYTHHRTRANPDQYGFNVGCLEGVNPFDLDEVKIYDGINHPSDQGAAR